MSEPRKFPGVFGWLAVLLLCGSIALAWYLTRPTADVTGKTAVAADDLEVACTGRVDSADRPIGLEPEVAGKVIQVYVKDQAPDNKVRKGEKILDIDPRMYKIKVDEAEQAMQAARIEVEKAEEDGKMFPTQLAGRKEMAAAAEANVLNAEKTLEAAKEAAKSETPPSKINQLKIEAAEASVKSQKLLRDVETRQIKMLEEFGPKNNAFVLRAATARFQTMTAAYDEAKRLVEECTLKAPEDGTILRNIAAKGGMIAPGTPFPFVVFAPAGPLVVRADLDQEFVGRVKERMTVELRDEARSNSPVWTGKVVSVSGYIAQKTSVLLEPGMVNDVRTAECVISIDESTDELRIGQRMRVRIRTR